MITGPRILPKMFSTPLSHLKNNTADPPERKTVGHSH